MIGHYDLLKFFMEERNLHVYLRLFAANFMTNAIKEYDFHFVRKWFFNQYEILYKFDNQGFPKIDHSGSAARIVLEQNEFSKKVFRTD